MPEDLRADDSVLGEVLRHAAAHHEQAGDAGGDLDLGQFAEVSHAHRSSDRACPPPSARLLVLDETEAGGAIENAGHEDRHALPHRRVWISESCFFALPSDEPLAHFVDELTRGVGARLKGCSQISRMVWSHVPEALPRRCTCRRCGRCRVSRRTLSFHLSGGLVVFEAKRFEEVHVNDRGACGDDRVDHAELRPCRGTRACSRRRTSSRQ
jgi:hypothetical protein